MQCITLVLHGQEQCPRQSNLIHFHILCFHNDGLERVYEHVAWEQYVEPAEPQQLWAMTEHGFLRNEEEREVNRQQHRAIT